MSKESDRYMYKKLQNELSLIDKIEMEEDSKLTELFSGKKIVLTK